MKTEPDESEAVENAHRRDEDKAPNGHYGVEEGEDPDGER